MRPDVSILITSYNIAGYINRAVESALNQQGVNVEVVIVDNCSSDSTWQVIEALGDPRIKKHQLEKNGGPSAARNAAIALATGEWLAVLDGDDAFAPERLQNALKLARAQGANIVVDNLLVCRESDGQEFAMFDSLPARLTLAEFIKGNQSFLGGYTLGYLKPVMRADFIKQHHLAYDPDIRIGEDYLLFAQALAEGASCVCSSIPGYRYTVRAGSISQRLKLADVERISACDAKLTSRYKLDAPAQKAQNRRTQKLREAFAFTQLIDALKARQAKGALAAICSYPPALLQLWRPIMARLKRVRHG